MLRTQKERHTYAGTTWDMQCAYSGILCMHVIPLLLHAYPQPAQNPPYPQTKAASTIATSIIHA